MLKGPVFTEQYLLHSEMFNLVIPLESENNV